MTATSDPTSNDPNAPYVIVSADSHAGLPTEDYRQYLATKFAKGCLRTNHVDSNSRLCMASAASGMTLSLGSDGPPGCYGDIELADAFLFVGSNAADCHPILFDRVAACVGRRGRGSGCGPGCGSRRRCGSSRRRRRWRFGALAGAAGRGRG